jgi:hypothetical protein
MIDNVECFGHGPDCLHCRIDCDLKHDLWKKQIEEERERSKRLEKALGFMKFCLLSGEKWSSTCEKVYEEALREYGGK